MPYRMPHHRSHFRRSILFALFFGLAGTMTLVETLQLPLGISWLAAVNSVQLLYLARDKWAAIHQLPRTPENTFFALALLGGFPGLFAGRRLFNHKTSKRPFIIRMWLLFILQLIFVAYHGGYIVV